MVKTIQSSEAEVSASRNNKWLSERANIAWMQGPANNLVLLVTSLRILVSEFREYHGESLRSKPGDTPKKMDPPKPCQLQEYPQKWCDYRSTHMLWIRAVRQPEAVT